MDWLKHLTIKMSSSEDKVSSDTLKESEKYCIKVPFPDDDQWVYLLHENGMLTGEIMKFEKLEDCEKYIRDSGFKNCVVEKSH